MPRLEHVGIAVSDPIAAAKLYELLLDLEAYKVEKVESERVSTIFLNGGGTKLELIASEHPESAIGRFVERHGPGLHHLAFEVPSVRQVMQKCRDAGLRVLNDEPTVGADGKIVAFLHPKDFHGTLIEFCESVRPVWHVETIEFHGVEVTRYTAGRLTSDDRPLLMLLTAGDFTASARHAIPLFEQRYDVCGFDIARMSPDNAASLLRATVRDFGGQRSDGTLLVCAPGSASLLAGVTSRSMGIRASVVIASTSGETDLSASDHAAARSLPRPLVISSGLLLSPIARSAPHVDEIAHAVVPDYPGTTEQDRQRWFANLAIRHFDGVR